MKVVSLLPESNLMLKKQYIWKKVIAHQSEDWISIQLVSNNRFSLRKLSVCVVLIIFTIKILKIKFYCVLLCVN